MYAIYSNIYHQYIPFMLAYIPYMDPMGMACAVKWSKDSTIGLRGLRPFLANFPKTLLETLTEVAVLVVYQK